MPTLEQRQDYFAGLFSAMASPCEILVDTTDEPIARQITDIAESEAKRIEHKLSRYRKGNIIHQINSGKKITVDNETARLLDYSQKLFELSEARFDITSGVLRRAWKFDGSNNIPDQADIEALLPLIGWEKIQWKNPVITLPKGMEIDLGGIGKEYAVDRAAQQVQSFFDSQDLQHQQVSVLLNFGGDISVLAPKNDRGRSWTIGIDTGIDGGTIHHDKNNTHTLIALSSGGVATSGDSRRFLIKDDKRYSHILDPASVTVAADTCTDAGMMSTLALLQGCEAETFLIDQGVDYWLRW